MEIKTIIEVMGYSTYGDHYTMAIMVCTDMRDVDSITKAYCSLRGLEGLSGLPSNMLSDLPNDFIKYLMKEGFSQLKTKTVRFTD